MKSQPPGSINYGSAGFATPHHLSMELFKQAAGVNLTHVPYKGTSGVMNDLVGNHVSAMFIPTHVAMPFMQRKQIRVLGIASRERVPAVPDIPTLQEQGIGEVENDLWFGLLAPAGTPPETVARFNTAINEIIRTKDMVASLAKQGLDRVRRRTRGAARPDRQGPRQVGEGHRRRRHQGGVSRVSAPRAPPLAASRGEVDCEAIRVTGAFQQTVCATVAPHPPSARFAGRGCCRDRLARSILFQAQQRRIMDDRPTLTPRSETRDGMRIDWDVPITMDDGLVLRADVFRPVKDGQYPVILTYGPYAKGLAFQDGYPSAWERMAREHPDVTAGSSNLYQQWEVVDPEKWVPHDYACVRVDSRGAGCSPGKVDPFSPRETKDFYDCIEWAGVQPWSNGKIGLNGISYYGSNQWHVATLQPPHLAAMCIWEGCADWYRDMTHHGGILCTFWENWYDMQVKTVQYGAGERGKRSRVHGGPRVRAGDADASRNSRATACRSATTSARIRWRMTITAAARRSGRR